MKKHSYPPKREFEHLKRFRAAASKYIQRQRTYLDKIERGKSKLPLSKEKVYALAKHDLKLLQQYQREFEERTSELRRKIHEETINGSRATPEESSDSR